MNVSQSPLAPAGSPALATPLSRRARKKERTRHEIYAAALSLFAARGFDAVSVEQICQAADVARATFFLHFHTKSALLFEFSRLLSAGRQAWAPSGMPRRRTMRSPACASTAAQRWRRSFARARARA